MKIAVIGAGIYGCHIALKLSEAGFEVDLVEKESDVMMVSTPISLRAHVGYFYARSPETMLSSKKNSALFQKEYPNGVVDHSTHYYIISKNGSKITGQEFLAILEKNGFPYQKATEPLINQDMIDTCIKAEEFSYDPAKLKDDVKKRLSESSVKLLLNTDVSQIPFASYDLKIIAGYASNNYIAKQITGEAVEEYEYRFCEKVVVRLPEAFHNKNFVVMDGPFFQIDPLGSEMGVFALSHFIHSVHTKSEGHFFELDDQMKSLLGKGLIKNPPISNAKEMLDSIRPYIPEIDKAEILGSLFAVKPVIPKETNDSRPTLVKSVRKDVITVLAGKVSGCIQAADECTKYAQSIGR